MSTTGLTICTEALLSVSEYSTVKTSFFINTLRKSVKWVHIDMLVQFCQIFFLNLVKLTHILVLIYLSKHV